MAKSKNLTVNKTVKGELELIRKRDGGMLKPERVVEYAENPDTALHSLFEWDDSTAGHRWRIQQARDIIRVIVEIIDEKVGPSRVFVSLSHDRVGGAGYRSMVDVMASDDLVEVMLDDAKRALDAFAKKYQKLRKLAEMRDVFEAIDKVQSKVSKKKAG